MTAPIAFFGFNRPDHTRRALEAIAASDQADQSMLYAFCDGPLVGDSKQNIDRIGEVREIILSQHWCAKIVPRFGEANRGLKASLLAGITEVVAAHGRVIVIEDDVIISPGFLRFMNEMLDLYDSDDRVMHVSGYSPLFERPENYAGTTVVLNHTFVGWGWATWQRAWTKLSTDGAWLRREIDRLGIRRYVNLDGTFEIYWALKALDEGRSQDWNAYWHASVMVHQGLCLHPILSLADNIGFDGSGTQCTPDGDAMLRPVVPSLPVAPIELRERSDLRRAMTKSAFRTRAEIFLRDWARRAYFRLLEFRRPI